MFVAVCICNSLALSIYTTYPSIYIWACILAGLLVSGLLYYPERKRNRFTNSTLYTLASLRFVGVTFMCLLLLRPITQWTKHVVEKPIIVALYDNSLSLNNQPTFDRELKDKLNALSNDAEIVYYHFDETLKDNWDSINFKGAATDLSQAIDQISTRYAGRNLASVVVATDGIFNKGSQPIYPAKNLQVPFFTVGLGDTMQYRDIRISEVEVNRVTFLGNSFPATIHTEGILAKGETARLTIEHKGQVIETRTIGFDSNESFVQENFQIQTKEKGTQHYVAKLSILKDEKSTINNQFDFYIQVLDNRQKILILAAAPHPDIAAIRSAFDQSDSYSIDYQLAEEWNGKIADYGMVIYHGLPQTQAQVEMIKGYENKGVPGFFLATSSTSWNLISQLGLGFGLQGGNGAKELRTAQINNNFQTFQFPDQLTQTINQWPPVEVPFGKFVGGEGIHHYFFQKVGNLNTGNPLLSFTTNTPVKNGILIGEGLWKWRMYSYIQMKNHNVFNEMINSWIQYLSNKDSDHLLRVVSKKKWSLNERISFQAQLFDASLKPLGNQNIPIQIWNEKNEQLNYNFIPDGDQYKLNIGMLAPGSYRFKSKANNGTKDYSEEGSFIVENVQLEQISSTAQHSALRQLSTQTSGAFFTPQNIDALITAIQNQKNLVTVTYDESSREEWIDLWPILLLVLLLFCTEWFIRKRMGSY
jgi:hypothetical protein